MPKIHLQLTIESDTNYGTSSTLDLPVSIHIHKRLEQFIYNANAKDPASLISYLENKSFDSRQNLSIINKTYTVPENSFRHIATKASDRYVSAKSITLEYADIIATNVSTIDSNGRQVPLYYKHILPAETTNVVLFKVEDGVESIIDSGFIVDLSAGAIYTNYQNFFNRDTGQSSYFFVAATASDFSDSTINGNYTTFDTMRSSGSSPSILNGTQLGFAGSPTNQTGTQTLGRSTKNFAGSPTNQTGTQTLGRQRQLLNPVPVASEATWEDIDIETGTLYTHRPLYSRTKASRGYTFTFNKGDQWWVRPLESGLLQPISPLHSNPDYSWYLQFTNGDVSALVNNKVRRYYLPEFNYQNFVPYKPLKATTYDVLTIANPNIVIANRTNLNINPELGLHLTLYIYDESDNLIKVLTTSNELADTRYKDSIFYTGGLISSWDNSSGCINLGINLFSNYKVVGSYTYKGTSYEYTTINVNPLLNQRMRDATIVYYCVPDVSETDRAIHSLIVDSDGKIIFASQGLGLGHVNLQLKNPDGSFNINSIIGSKYSSDVDSDNFLVNYTAGYQNDYGYMVLCEVAVNNLALQEEQEEFDLRESGIKLKASKLEKALNANPKIQQSIYCDSPFGMQIPEENILIVEAPLSLTVEYGGSLTKSQVESFLKVLMPTIGYMLVEWVYPKSVVTVRPTEDGASIVLDISFEGAYDYLIYRSSSTEPRTLITTLSPTSIGLVSYTDTSVESGSTYTYSVSIVDTYEYPSTDIKVMVP